MVNGMAKMTPMQYKIGEEFLIFLMTKMFNVKRHDSLTYKPIEAIKTYSMKTRTDFSLPST